MRRPPNLSEPTMAAAPVMDQAGPPASYLPFYGLSNPPFDGGDYIVFGSHKRSYEMLNDHVVNGSGVVLLQGEEGIGKTETLRAAFAIAVESGVPTIIVPRPQSGRITQAQLMAAIGDTDTTAEEAVERFLAPPRKALLVDDFDLMPDDCVRLLSSLIRRLPDSPDGPTVVLSSSSGLPAAVGRSPDSKADSLPITTIRIPRLGPTEVQQYIEGALWSSGGTSRRLISQDAIKLVIERSGGVPALVNRLMEAAFDTGFARGDSVITAGTLAAAMGEPLPSSPPIRQVRIPSGVPDYAVKIAATVLLILGVSTFLYSGLTGQPRHPMAADVADIAATRLAYQQAADAGDATAATALAKTYDPSFAPPGGNPDTAQAADWYQKAIALGDPQAANYLRRLGAH